ncbi:MAG: hypothetical protein LBI53_07825 [Candidatus Peribacteria bacterium]|nr:hypothetical protein [Candidatus Peribacteria bacterium]
MLKKVFALLGAFVLTATLVGCGTPAEPTVTMDDEVIVEFENVTDEGDLAPSDVEVFVDDVEMQGMNEDVVVVDVDSFVEGDVSILE